MTLIADDSLEFAGTGDAGFAYQFNGVKGDAEYISPVLDGGTAAKWGKVYYTVKGNITVTARSGNRELPGSDWTLWSQSIKSGTSPGVKSARYIQFKISFLNSSDATFYRVALNYKSKNERAKISNFNAGTRFADSKKTTDNSDTTSEISKRTITGKPDDENKKEIVLSWTVNNPDEDKLRYKLYFKNEKSDLWMPIFKEDYIYTGVRYTWDTSQTPSGRYELKLVADDSPSNNFSDVLKDEYISVPVEIDNHPPIIKTLVYKNGIITGSVSDDFSNIAAVMYAIDNDPFFYAECKDGVCDSTKEDFSFTPRPEPAEGPHIVTVKIWDTAGNFSLKELEIVFLK
ncbi:MAG: hypothetical protein JXR91_03655 [Deltaproteobacteria bacterium]|nr:hypothetical protein [Deltaproteobacteria bacterium]